MLPTEDAEWVGAELTRRFGLPRWSFALTATDANRWAIRLARAVTGRPKILVNSYCYHGSVDESLIVVGADGGARSREGNVGAPYDVTQTSRVAEFNDLDGLERELAHGDVAAVLMEPALTNIGIVLPEPGYLDGVRELTRRHGTLLINDETHTFSAGPGGATRAWGLDPDVVTSARRSAAASRSAPTACPPSWPTGCSAAPTSTWSTWAGSAARWPATRCRSRRPGPRWSEVLTDAAFAHDDRRWRPRSPTACARSSPAHGLPWSVSPARRPGRVPLRRPGRRAPARESHAAARRRARRLPAPRTWPTAACC